MEIRGIPSEYVTRVAVPGKLSARIIHGLCQDVLCALSYHDVVYWRSKSHVVEEMNSSTRINKP